jgi:hypothetical protein
LASQTDGKDLKKFSLFLILALASSFILTISIPSRAFLPPDKDELYKRHPLSNTLLNGTCTTTDNKRDNRYQAPGTSHAIRDFAPAGARQLRLTTSRNGYAWNGLIVTGRTAHVAYEEARGGINRVWYLRSGDNGATWGYHVQLSQTGAPYAFGPALAGIGSYLDAVWTETTLTGDYVVVYANSKDGGLTWSSRRILSPTPGDAGFARVARAGPDRVAVVWTDNTTGEVCVRTSTDGGTTFAGLQTLATSTNSSDVTGGEGFAAVAMGSSAWYAAFYENDSTIKLRRSVDLGVTWGAATTLTTSGNGYGLDLAASGPRVILGYGRLTATDLFSAARRSVDSGAHWSAETAVGIVASPYSFSPVVAIAGRRWRVAYEQCRTIDCLSSATYYRDSSDGLTWSSPPKAVGTARSYNSPAGVTSSGAGTLVLYSSFEPDVDDNDVILSGWSLKWPGQ